MKHFVASSVGRTFILRLERGDDLLDVLKELAQKENISNAAVVSGIATFDEVNMHMTTTFGYPIGYHKVQLKEPLELASLDGTIVDAEPHIHGVVSNAYHTWAGHMLEGCRVLYLGEVVVQELLGCSLTRQADENGVRLIYEKE